MYLTQKNHLRGDKKTYKILKILTRLSKNLYNYTLYTVRQYFELNNQFLNYESAYHHIKENENYKLLPSQVAQQTMKIVDRSFKSFFRLIQERQKGNYNRPIKMPYYLPKNGYFVIIFPKNMFKIINNKIRLSLGRNFKKECGIQYLEFQLPKNIIGKKIKEVRIIPKYNGLWFEIEYVYEVESIDLKLDKNNYLSIDLGLDNFATCFSTTSRTPFIIEGRDIKSFNCWWNKRKAELQSIYDKQGIKFGKKMTYLLNKRKNVINNFMNQSVNYIIKYCIKNNIGRVVIGELKEIKQNINLGKNNNRNFVLIPYGLFKQKLQSKCKLFGIDYIEVDEAYTSKCDALALEPIKKHKKYLGNRIKRGLFQSSIGKLINADVNGAINILRKIAGDSLVKGILSNGLVNSPVRVRVV
ncbi:transposase [Methanothermococcus sp. Ax23]|uniref:RNA-guided endonuclease InsQ/TnpB family protein n=1 Tax=Methanothermococcus sp. Ax23 TaxID=3156486 RepID=UPI003B9F1BD1